jgi:AmpD protein
MKIDTEGRLTAAHFLPSSHCDARPKNKAINMVVVHNISLPPGEFGTGAIERFFCAELDFTEHSFYESIAALKVSAHLLINRQGVITQFVPFQKRAWHAGESYFAGETNCNDFSIGIELEGTDFTPFDKIQYTQLSRVIKCLMTTYGTITRDRIVGHSDIAPGRKTDPGPFFDWNTLDQLLA